MTHTYHPNSSSSNDSECTAPQTDQLPQAAAPATIHMNHNIKALNMRWQEIRKWEMNRLRVQELNHHLAFMRKSIKNTVVDIQPLKAKNDPVY